MQPSCYQFYTADRLARVELDWVLETETCLINRPKHSQPYLLLFNTRIDISLDSTQQAQGLRNAILVAELPTLLHYAALYLDVALKEFVFDIESSRLEAILSI